MLIHDLVYNRHCTNWSSMDTWQYIRDDPNGITCLECQQLYKRAVIVHAKGINCALRAARELRYGPIREFVTVVPKSITCEACKNSLRTLRKANTPIIETSPKIVTTNKTIHWWEYPSGKGALSACRCADIDALPHPQELMKINCLLCLENLVEAVTDLQKRTKTAQQNYREWRASWIQMWANIGAAIQVWRPKPKVEDTMPQDEAARKRFELLEID